MEESRGGRYSSVLSNATEATWTTAVQDQSSFSFDSQSTLVDSSPPRLFTQHEPQSKPQLKPPLVDMRPKKPLVHYKIRALPHQGLFVPELPISLLQASHAVRFECQRIALDHKVPIEEIARTCRPEWQDHQTFKSDITRLLSGRARSITHSSKTAFEEGALLSAYVYYSGRIEYEEAHGEKLFALKLLPIAWEEKTCSPFLEFGAHRFLRLRMPSMRSRPKDSGITQADLRMAINEWLPSSNKRFLGCSWTCYYVKVDHTTAKARKYRDEPDHECLDLFLFATEGPGLEPITARGLMDWFIPLELNKQMLAAKAFKRQDMILSKTIPSIYFRPEEIIWVDDILADGTPEDSTFNDPTFGNWTSLHLRDNPRVMNDGHTRMSYRAALMIWKHFQSPDRELPSAFQARIGSAKGMWSVAPPHVKSPRGDDIWIEISQSQTKWARHQDDFSLASLEPVRNTLLVLRWTQPMPSSSLYFGFLPILIDRGVRREAISDLVEEWFEEIDAELEEAILSREYLLRWAQKKMVGSQEVHTQNPWNSWENASTVLKIKKLVMAGFDPLKFKPLGNLIIKEMTFRMKDARGQCRVPLKNSTYVFGISDPVGVLKPGEIHFYPSVSFDGGSPGDFFQERNVLVARNPALRNHDIQKVRMVLKPELVHLRNVVVFSVHGECPLAHKLQGGDYDGDTFWICWEPSLVEPFHNASLPTTVRTLEECGIRRDQTKLGDLLAIPEREFFEHSFKLAMQQQMLAICTVLHSKLSYVTNSVQSPSLDALADLHSHVIDAAKNGYLYDKKALDEFSASFQDPHIEEANRTHLPWKNIEKHWKSRDLENSPHIINHVLFNVMRRRTDQTMHRLEDRLGDAERGDADCSALFTQYLASDDLREQRLAHDLREDVSAIVKLHRPRAVSDEISYVERSRIQGAGRQKLWEALMALEPRIDIRDDPVVDRTANKRDAPAMPTTWELLRASAFFTLASRERNGYWLALDMCWREVLLLKAMATSPPALCEEPLFLRTKMRKPWRRAMAEEVAFEEDEDGLDADAEIGGGEVFYDAEDMMDFQMTQSTIEPHEPVSAEVSFGPGQGPF